MGEICGMCGGKYIEIQNKVVGDTMYKILKCEKCGHLVARTVD